MELPLNPAIFNLDMKIKLLPWKHVKALSGENKNINKHSKPPENQKKKTNQLF